MSDLTNCLHRQLLCQQELDMVKLVFSLIDTDGQMTLSAAKINRFVFNILGKSLSDVT